MFIKSNNDYDEMKLEKIKINESKASFGDTMIIPLAKQESELITVPLVLCDIEKSPIESYIPSNVISPASINTPLFSSRSPISNIPSYPVMDAPNSIQPFFNYEQLNAVSSYKNENLILPNSVFASGRYISSFSTFSAAVHDIDP